MKVLHLSHHYGCLKDHQYVCNQLGIELESKFSKWSQVIPKDTYIITKHVVKDIWSKYADYFNTFDYIITSDTAPLSRIFLENIDDLKSKVIIWVCNRFNYNMEADAEYHQLIGKYADDERVKIVPYTEFERFWLERSSIRTEYETIRPIGLVVPEPINESEEHDVGLDGDYKFDDSPGDVLVSRYHNDNIFQDSKSRCERFGLTARHAKYRGAVEFEKLVKNYECFLMFPDAYSKFTTFELMQMQMPVILPSESLLLNLSRQPNYFFSTGVIPETVKYCEWYNEYYEKFAVYFEDLAGIGDAVKMVKDNKEQIKSLMAEAAKQHTEKTLQQWRKIYEEV
tara:strand:+ start:570 stop:1589 length:1020 start_codon:yes stop_codon:yes gene_type:complete